MRVDVLTLRYDPTRGVLDDAPLRAFTRDKVILSVRDHFFMAGDVPHLALVVESRLPAPSARDGSSGQLGGSQSSKTEDLRASLSADHRERFDLLRA